MENWLTNMIIDLYGETLAPVQNQVAHALGVVDAVSTELAELSKVLEGMDSASPEYFYILNLVCSVKENPICAVVDSPDTFVQALDKLSRTWEVNLHALGHLQLSPSLTASIKNVQLWSGELKVVQKRVSSVIDSYEPVLNRIALEKRSILKPYDDFISTTSSNVTACERSLLVEADSVLSSIPIPCSAFELFKSEFKDFLGPWRAAWLCAELHVGADNDGDREKLSLLNRLLLKPGDFPFSFEADSENDLAEAFSFLQKIAPCPFPAVSCAALACTCFKIREKFSEIQPEQQSVPFNSLRRLRREIHKYLQTYARAWVAGAAVERSIKETVLEIYSLEMPNDVIDLKLA